MESRRPIGCGCLQWIGDCPDCQELLSEPWEVMCARMAARPLPLPPRLPTLPQTADLLSADRTADWQAPPQEAPTVRPAAPRGMAALWAVLDVRPASDCA